MAEHDITPEVTISKTQRHYQVGYVSVCHQNRKTGMTTHYSQHPSQHLKGDWLAEAGFETGTGVTAKISKGCLILIAESNEVQELRKELYLVKQVVKGMKSGISGVLREV
ncbi:toxin SymE, type I toxin-antitoxin system family protein [Escherichia sp. E4208]|uniref:SymE family type I addiction module toxin n=1 Tax=unclassified Escherichia TaxID=2608889 RepID=UPI00102887D7|nr:MULTISPECIES: SymE family type I addiction module toxin [unclassified Escherichia]RZM93445.1 type I addiction module toxin, SymE family [Escherichia sp. E14V5]RZN00509.1 type I addiction module toxin, SymE family [Escherichia sp. E14V7]RZN27104.1 type I addiction module toxin, SymE family [Escherichia sp. E14V10]TGB54651.1 toxin SymE, type I toxin-antitoxin system family protein [Escherichia sp. E5028]TGB86584.1 toxin SymE, type I toxin-antitoxin system family protein [Escherichia sp. E4208